MPITLKIENSISSYRSGSGGSSDDNLKVYLFTLSQSNMGSGTSVGLGPPYAGTQNAWIYNGVTDVIERMNVGVNTALQSYPLPPINFANAFGPETVSGTQLSAIRPDKVLIIKYLNIGTSMTGSTPNWTISDNTLYPAAKSIMAAGLAKAETFFSLPKNKIEIKGLIRMQGEADADNGVTTDVQNKWKVGHTTTTNDLLRYIAGLGYIVNTCRLVTGRIKTFSPPRPKENEVRLATVDFADNYLVENPSMTNYVANSVWINNDSLTTSDGVHYDQSSNIVFGQNVGAALTPYINETFVPTFSSMEEDVNGIDVFEDSSIDEYENRLI